MRITPLLLLHFRPLRKGSPGAVRAGLDAQEIRQDSRESIRGSGSIFYRCLFVG